MPISRENRELWKREGRCTQCGRVRAPGRKKCESCLEVNRRASKKYRPQSEESRSYYRERKDRIRVEVITAYGGSCACCGETEMDFLQLDHSFNDGGKHRAESRNSGARMFEVLRRDGFPQDLGLQVLCANCHFAITYRGVCPHGNLPTRDSGVAHLRGPR